MSQKYMKRVSLGLLLILAPVLTGCQTIKENPTVAGGGIGALLGGVLGGVIYKDDPAKGVLVGAVIGGALGAGTGYLWAQNFKAESEYSRVQSQEDANAAWAENHGSDALPAVAVPHLVPEKSVLTPGRELRPEEDAVFRLAYASVGEQPYRGTLCRLDSLYVVPPSQQPTHVLDLEEVCMLPTLGESRHDSTVQIPADMEPGDYELKSKLVDHENPDFRPIQKDFPFKVLPKSVATDTGTDVKVLRSNLAAQTISGPVLPALGR